MATWDHCQFSAQRISTVIILRNGLLQRSSSASSNDPVFSLMPSGSVICISVIIAWDWGVFLIQLFSSAIATFVVSRGAVWHRLPSQQYGGKGRLPGGRFRAKQLNHAMFHEIIWYNYIYNTICYMQIVSDYESLHMYLMYLFICMCLYIYMIMHFLPWCIILPDHIIVRKWKA